MIAALVLVLALPDALPNGAAIKQRVLASWRNSEKALENYSCTVHEQNDELKADGSLQKRKSSVKEQFFVNGIQVEHTLARDGQPLSTSAAKKEQERVDKEVKKYSDPETAEKARKKDEKQADLFLHALRLENGRREIHNGRSTLLYDLSGDPAFHARKLEERFAQALVGRIAVDEESGTPSELRFETGRDIKIAAGVLGNLRKGFWLHITQQRQPDGVWIAQQVEGSGEARALFLHARFRFRQELEKCHLFSVETRESIRPAPSQ
jgi:hypothetical protein